MIRKPALRLGLALSATILSISVASEPADAAPVRPHIPVCKSEDGSYLGKHGKVRYQRICVWDARRLGNHRGHSFLLIQGPRGQHAIYVRISHRLAKDLTR